MACGCSNKSANAPSSHVTMAEFSRLMARTQARSEQAPGIHYEGYVLARFLLESGIPRIPNGRSYPLMLRGEEWWVHPDDVAARPKWWSLVDVPEPA